MITTAWRHLIGCSLAAALLLTVNTSAFAQTAAPILPTAESEASPVATAPVVATDPTFSHLFKDVVGDFRRLPSRDAAKWIGAGLAAAVIAHAADARVTRSFSGSRGLDETFEAGQTIGGARVQLAGSLGTYAFGRLTRNPGVAGLGADLLRAQIVAQAATGAVKFSVRRTRPDGQAFSFPSGHVSVTFASATVLQNHFGWRVGIPAYGVASYVAASRIQSKRHYLSDVAFGAVLGIVAGRTVTVGHGRFAVSPMTAPGGGGVAFTWVGAH